MATWIKKMETFEKHGRSAFVRTRIPRPQIVLQPIQSSRRSGVCRYGIDVSGCLFLGDGTSAEGGKGRLDFVVLCRIELALLHILARILAEVRAISQEPPNRLF